MHIWWEDVVILLFGTIFDVTLIDKKYGNDNISFEVTYGEYANYLQDVQSMGDEVARNRTYLTKSLCNKRFCYLDFEDKLPCINIQSEEPDFRRRMYNSNILNKMVFALNKRCKKISKLFEKLGHMHVSKEIEKEFLEAIEFISSSCQKYIDIFEPLKEACITELDKQRFKLFLQEMAEIIEVSKSIYNPKQKRRSFRKLIKILEKLQPLSNVAQDGWPDIYVWLVKGNRRVCHKILKSSDYLYSSVSEERGIRCGKVNTLFFEPPSNILERLASTVACKVELMLWIGLLEEKEHCLNCIPSGFTFEGEIPRTLVIMEKYNFICRAHIYQGRLTPGYDDSGLADAFCRVIVGKYFYDTNIQEGTLNPFWDQCLIFRNVTFNGSTNFIKSCPPTIVLEIYDQDRFYSTEFIGRGTINPKIKLTEEIYSSPEFPPELEWVEIENDVGEKTGELLVAVECIQQTSEEDDEESSYEVVPIPADIKPQIASYRVDIVFWGVRNLKRVQMLRINKPKISVECKDTIVQSETIQDATKTLNFEEMFKSFDVILPDHEEFAPPIVLKMFDSRSFGRSTYAGIHLCQVASFLYQPTTKLEREQIITGLERMSDDLLDSKTFSSTLFTKKVVEQKLILPKERPPSEVKVSKRRGRVLCWLSRKIKTLKKQDKKSKVYEEENHDEESDEEYQDWWLKYHLSHEKDDDSKKVTKLEEHENALNIEKELKHVKDSTKVIINIKEKLRKEKIKLEKVKLKIYNSELENQPEFGGFTDTLKTFDIFKGKKTGDDIADEELTTGHFKGNIKIYKWPPENNLVEYVNETGHSLENGFFQEFFSNEFLNFTVRIYCVKGTHLKPKDLSGRSDPFVIVSMGDQVISDRDNYISKQISPTFGRCFEFKGTFPFDHTIKVAVMDYDMQTADDLIGETKIDIENRYYTKHRARCGISKNYFDTGPYAWRGHLKPTQILAITCKKYNLDEPEYKPFSVIIGCMEFVPDEFEEKHLLRKIEETTESFQDYPEPEISELNKEIIALNALHRWKEFPLIGFSFVPEHVESRSLYHPARPGIEQGKLQMWVDIFPTTDILPPPQVDISPRKPIPYELRVTIWNTEAVVMNEDDFFSGEKKSDIYVKGWLSDSSTEQSTDVHYRSLSGEGNFNWRFVFPFGYLTAEKKVSIIKKDNMFSDEYEIKLPCKLVLQVWDNDSFSHDDFLGAITMDLSKFPRGARSAKKCSLAIVAPGAPTLNLFKIKRTKGWWPFQGVHKHTLEYILAGKLEAEFELVTKDEAENRPAGLGRETPQPLPPPKRPDTSFSWFRNPCKAIKYVICKQYKLKMLLCLLFLFLVLFGALAIYALPGYSVKKILHV